ncbi:NUDIX hydrolase [Halostella sp. JP-L12]|uniref:NUDIX hydrolase n=1 Tax=Halostella TaxID=1843185 RepID=UPI000EF82B95|nr:MULTISPECIES: NUDIX hydrolase [Halostella]NHN48138.1 NUDIX hydrolase [Halostella sp. JP-L12]
MSDHDWPVIESATEYETGWYDGGYDLVEQPDGTTKRYYWAELPPAVVVVPVVDGDVVFVEQYRPTVRETQLELPAGIVEDHTEGDAHAEGTVPRESGESYESAAARELREETGYDPDETTLLQTCDVATGAMRHERGFVAAAGLTETGRELDENEFLTVERVPVEEAVATARELPTNDATLEGLLLAKEDGLL